MCVRWSFTRASLGYLIKFERFKQNVGSLENACIKLYIIIVLVIYKY